MESHAVRNAKINRMAEIVANANDLKEHGDTTVGDARDAERDALSELAEECDSVEDVEAVALPHERV